MRQLTAFGVVLCVMSLATLAVAEVPYETWTEVPPDIVVPQEPVGPLPPGEPTDDLTFYTDQALFESLFPCVAHGDFEATLVPPNSVLACPGPFNSLTNNQCFAPGGIIEGISFNTVQQTDMVVLTPPFLGVVDVAAGPNTFLDDSIITFDPPVPVFGIVIIMPFGPCVVDIEVFGAAGSLGTTTAQGSLLGDFWGVSSDEPITQIIVTEPAGCGELFGPFQFGEGVSAADGPTWGALKGIFLR